MRLTQKVALITGAGSGIGRAAALLLAQEGARVAALGRTEDELQQVVGEIKERGGEAIVVVADVSCAEQMQRAVAQTIERWGRLDIVFANAAQAANERSGDRSVGRVIPGQRSAGLDWQRDRQSTTRGWRITHEARQARRAPAASQRPSHL
ncbi:MAG TPA: SDR family NAD(P)-dependent oxidoreductase [Roseiflexaceae bacterium]|nr:SDR family NAD(P)-dependent oxidoreductase [Roseiflexaceae bacterium]